MSRDGFGLRYVLFDRRERVGKHPMYAFTGGREAVLRMLGNGFFSDGDEVDVSEVMLVHVLDGDELGEALASDESWKATLRNFQKVVTEEELEEFWERFESECEVCAGRSVEPVKRVAGGVPNKPKDACDSAHWLDGFVADICRVSGWSREYVLWELPLCAAMGLMHSEMVFQGNDVVFRNGASGDAPAPVMKRMQDDFAKLKKGG